MRQLRTSLTERDFVEHVSVQASEGYELAYLEDEGRVVSVAGFRVLNMLAGGKTLYVDDLVTDAALRSRGFGDTIVRDLLRHARELACDTFSLDSGTQRLGAHRFYFRLGMHISSFHFSLDLAGASDGR